MLQISLFLLLAAIMLILTAVANWKLPKERAKKWEWLGSAIFIVGTAVVSRVLPLFLAERMALSNDNFILLPMMTESALPLMIPIWLSVCPLVFFASGYIRYLKNKTDIATLQSTVKLAAGFHLSTILLAILCVVLFVRWQ